MKIAPLALGLLTGLLAGCRNAPAPRIPNLPPVDGESATSILKGVGFANVELVDLAVLPVEDRTVGKRAPVGALRWSVWAGLPDQLYSPLGLEFVDRRWLGDPEVGEASFVEDGLALPWDASLHLAFTRWDTSRLRDSGTVFARVEVRLREAGGELAAGGISEGEPVLLWGANLTRPLQVSAEAVAAGVEVANEEAIGLMAAEILEQLPARDEL